MRRIQEEIINVFTLGLLLFSIIVAIALHNFIPMELNQSQQPQAIQKAERIYTDYQELLLQFDDENESTKCLQWLNKTPAKHLRSSLKRAKIHSNRIDTLLSHRPYTTWTEVFYLPKVGITTLENIITAWRKTK